MFGLSYRFLLVFCLLAIFNLALGAQKNLLEILSSGDGVGFPYKELELVLGEEKHKLLFIPDGTNEECIKAAEIRCSVLERSGVTCLIYRLISGTFTSPQGLDREGSNIPFYSGSKYSMVLEVDIRLDEVVSDEEKYRKFMPAIEKEIERSNINAKFIFFISKFGNPGDKYVYTGNGGISKLEEGVKHYAYLYNDKVTNKIDIQSRADLRSIERARKIFIEALSKVDANTINEEQISELAARLRTIESVLNHDGSCKECKSLNKSCSHCSNFVSTERMQESFKLARKLRKYDVTIETKISRHVNKGTYASLFVRSNVNDDRIPNFSQSIGIGSMGNVRHSVTVPHNLGQNCQGLSEQDTSLVLRMISLFQVYFENIKLRMDYDELCIAVYQMSRMPSDRSRRDMSPYSVKTCAISTALTLGNFYPSFISKAGTLDSLTENSLITFCSAVLKQEPLGLVDSLSPVYSPSGNLESPTHGKLNASILLIKSRSEESVMTSLEGGTCSLQDIFNAGWKFDKKLRIWVRGNGNRIPLPIMVRYGLTDEGKLAAFSLEGRDAVLYSKGADVLKTDPEYTPLYSSLIGDRCLSPSNVDNFKKVSKAYEHETIRELNEAQRNVEYASLNSKMASKAAAEAVIKYQEAIDNEKKAMELARIATEMKNYHDAKLRASQRAEELAKLEQRLVEASKRRAEAANVSAKALLEASEAESRRRDASLKARIAAEKAAEHIKSALEIQKQLKLQLKHSAKLSASYESAVVAEDRLRKAHNEAQESLEKIIANEREITNNYEREMRSLVEEEEKLRISIEEYSNKRITLLNKLDELNKILKGKVEESKRIRDQLREEAKLKERQVEIERGELGKVLNLMDSKSAEVTAVSVSIKESEILLKEMELVAEQKAREAEAAKKSYMEMSNKMKELNLIFETLTTKLHNLSKKQRQLEESVKLAEEDLKLMLRRLVEVEGKIAEYEESRSTLDEKSKEAIDLLAKETALHAKIEEIKNMRQSRKQELDKLLEEQTGLKTDISALLVARSSALGIIRKTLRDIEEARMATQDKTAQMKEEYKKSSQLAEESMRSVEKLKGEVCRALSEEELKSKELQEKIKCVNRMDLEVKIAEEELNRLTQVPVPEVPPTPCLPKIKCEVIE
ncbi:coiled coil protein [Cryptosporidium felis]|nr:coiled coil protein [Cryptosporidium felis]